MSDGHAIHVVKYEPKSSPIGHIHLLHGMAEHIGRYEDFANYLVEQGYMVSGHDHRGHGRTAEKNGQLGFFAGKNGFDRVTEDVREVLLHVREKFENVPLILFGHSMGSFVTRRYMQKYSESLSKVIICGTSFTPVPLGRAGSIVGKVTTKLQSPLTEGKMLHQLVFGGFGKQVKDSKTSFDWLNTNEIEVKRYIEDPLCGFVPTNQFYIDLFDGLIKIHNNKENAQIRKELPVLFISGSQDPVGNNGEGVFNVAKGLTNLGMQKVQVHLIENSRHEILLEKNKQQTYKIISEWLQANE